MAFELPPLPYAKDALAPHISAETLEYHYGKHHQTYVTNLNKLVDGTEFENASLEDVIMKADGGLFNNAAQVWNHTFYWNSMTPGGGGEPDRRPSADAINSAFGSYDDFNDEVRRGRHHPVRLRLGLAGRRRLGLEIMKTANADLPMKHGAKALLTIDVWEHAYYIDYRNARPNYIETFLDSLVNWDFVAENLG